MYIFVVMNSVAELKLEMLLKRVKVIQIRQDEFCGPWFFKTLVNTETQKHYRYVWDSFSFRALQ